METKMATWINSRLIELDWSQRELARRAGLSPATVSNVVAGRTGVTFDFCAAIGKALGEKPETMFRAAGLLPPVFDAAELSEDEYRLIELYRSADQLQRESIVGMAELLSRPSKQQAQ
jgi:transcriptional regulator with XRE-family HTH domain